MTTPPPRSSAPGTPDETGAVRDRRRRGGLLPLWLLLGLLALLALGLILYFSLRGGSKKTAVVSPVAPVATTATPLDTSSPDDAATGAGGVASAPLDTSTPPDTDAATPGAVASTAGVPAPPASAPAPPASAPVSAAPAPTTPAGNLVGGAGKAPVAATGKDAEPGDTGTVLFAENSSDVDVQGKMVIAAAAAASKADKATKVAVTGYTDKVAGTPVNDPLSQERADKVAAILRADLGSGISVSTAAQGESDPAATNDTAAGRAQNRRAVISTTG